MEVAYFWILFCSMNNVKNGRNQNFIPASIVPTVLFRLTRSLKIHCDSSYDYGDILCFVLMMSKKGENDAKINNDRSVEAIMIWSDLLFK